MATRTFSSSSGLNLPPVRNLPRSFFRCWSVFSIVAFKVEKSLGSSREVVEDESGDAAAARASSFCCLPPFLLWLEEMLKWRCVEGYIGRGCEAVLRNKEDGLAGDVVVGSRDLEMFLGRR